MEEHNQSCPAAYSLNQKCNCSVACTKKLERIKELTHKLNGIYTKQIAHLEKQLQCEKQLYASLLHSRTIKMPFGRVVLKNGKLVEISYDCKSGLPDGEHFLFVRDEYSVD
jgi:hypothetical protein